MPAPPPVLAATRRGPFVEAVARGHVAVSDASGQLLAAVGDPSVPVTLRSCVKPLQALPFVAAAMDPLGASDDELAVACASHSGEPVHVQTVRRLLARAGVEETALGCGPQLPFDETAAASLLASGGQPRPVHNNCSGKHAAMLATCAVRGWPLEGYTAAEHPCQAAVTAALSRCLGLALTPDMAGIDGCGLPTFGVPLHALARGFAAAAGDQHFRRCQDAMGRHAQLVGGTGRFDTALLETAGSAVTAKSGGAAIWVALERRHGWAVALKLEAGEPSALPPIAVASLQRLGALPATLPPVLQRFARPVLRNWAGAEVGEITVNHAPLEPLAAVPA